MVSFATTLIARFMGSTWGPSGAGRTQVGPMLGPMNLAIWGSSLFIRATNLRIKEPSLFYRHIYFCVIVIQVNRDLLALKPSKFTPEASSSSNSIWRHRSGSTLAQVMACCLTTPIHLLNQCCWLFNEVSWHSPESNFTASAQATIPYNKFENILLK